MSEEQQRKVQEAVRLLSSVMHEWSIDNNINHYFQMAETKPSIILMGNSEGFVYLAKLALDLAVAKTEGKHYHLGEGALENCTKELELLYRHFELSDNL